MKLYTEEQVKQMIDDAHNGVYFYTDILKKCTPIELPSDEEIIKESDDYELNSRASLGFEAGAKWMRDKIGGNK